MGLGPGDPGLLTREAWDVLSAASEVWLRTARHPTVAGLPTSLTLQSFDSLYEAGHDVELVYAAIVERLLQLGTRPEGVVYAVPGHPLVGETTVAALLGRAGEAGLPVRLVAGLSFIEPVLAALGQDPLSGLFVTDALDVAGRHQPPFHPDAPALIAQLHSTALASDVKLTLMAQYPDEHPVVLVHAAGTPAAERESLPLYAIDRSSRIAHLTCLFVPPLPRASAFESFQDLIARLRAPDGCPWDREQTHASLQAHLLEESYEVLGAIDSADPNALREELGDLMLQIVLQSQIAVEAGEFRLADVLGDIHAKIVRRHPHVFADVQVKGVEDVLKNWQTLKAHERSQATTGEPTTQLAGLPAALPALAQADAYQGRVAAVGFDWPELSGVVAKVHEELAEVADAGDPARRQAELGDLLFAVVNYARWLKVDPESALRQANARFRSRFEHVEAAARAQGRRLDKLSLQELNRLWDLAKRERG